MNHRILVLALGAITFTQAAATATRSYEQWIGVWQGELDGQPGVTVTLGRDAGDLEGTIVFNVISRDGGQAHVLGHDAHVLTQIRLDEGRLTFHVTRTSDSVVLHLAMRLTQAGKASLECADCGGPPSTELLRIR